MITNAATHLHECLWLASDAPSLFAMPHLIITGRLGHARFHHECRARYSPHNCSTIVLLRPASAHQVQRRQTSQSLLVSGSRGASSLLKACAMPERATAIAGGVSECSNRSLHGTTPLSLERKWVQLTRLLKTPVEWGKSHRGRAAGSHGFHCGPGSMWRVGPLPLCDRCPLRCESAHQHRHATFTL
jgi:hypothetical protein